MTLTQRQKKFLIVRRKVTSFAGVATEMKKVRQKSIKLAIISINLEPLKISSIALALNKNQRTLKLTTRSLLGEV
jgi:hypothetical protein